ncbi:MAG: hypothetical protein LBG74_05600 [Spirochaetaceae bacterium]|jgi:hypothetical protein|nr:hypothetical protein [Spirochaetaceae bacterium]
MNFFRVFGAGLLLLCLCIPAAAQQNPPAAKPADAQQSKDGGKNEDEKEEEKPPPLKEYDPVGNFIFSFGGALVFYNEDGGVNTAPAPVLPVPYAAFDWIALRRGVFNMGLGSRISLYWNNYLWQDKRPWPAEIENRQAFVTGIVPAVAARFVVHFNRIMLHIHTGISADLRIVTEALDLNAEDEDEARRQTALIRGYFWENARFLYPLFVFGMDFPVTRKWRLGVEVSASMPFSQMANGETLGLDAWRLGIGVSISRHFFLKPAQKEKPENSEPADTK